MPKDWQCQMKITLILNPNENGREKKFKCFSLDFSLTMNTLTEKHLDDTNTLNSGEHHFEFVSFTEKKSLTPTKKNITLSLISEGFRWKASAF